MTASKKINFLIILSSTGLVFLSFSCAGAPKEKILKNMMIGAAAGFALGQLKSENKTGIGCCD